MIATFFLFTPPSGDLFAVEQITTLLRRRFGSTASFAFLQ